MVNESYQARHARLEIDLGVIAQNYHTIVRRNPRAQTAAVVKANAYGLGVDGVVPALLKAGCKVFFTATPAEGAAVRALNESITIYTLNGFGAMEFMRQHNLTPVINHVGALDAWRATGLPYALHVDTGMNRLGLSVAEFGSLAADVNCALIMSHLAVGEEGAHPKNHAQLDLFAAARRRWAETPASLANSAGTVLGDSYAYDLVRSGIALYGGGIGAMTNSIKPSVRLLAPVLSVRTISKGESVGYGATFIARSAMRVATLGIGYADGLLRAYTGQVWAGGGKCPIIGRMSMDLTTIDVSASDIQIGDEVEVFGPNISLSEVAQACNTIDYEILTRLGSRLERQYINA